MKTIIVAALCSPCPPSLPALSPTPTFAVHGYQGNSYGN